MKRAILTSLLLLGIFLQTFSDLILVVHYEINKSYITQHFCVNRDKPYMHCNGKCHLKKQLEENHKKEPNPFNNAHHRHDLQLFPTNLKFTGIAAHLKSDKRLFYYHLEVPQPYLSSIFRPPKLTTI